MNKLQELANLTKKLGKKLTEELNVDSTKASDALFANMATAITPMQGGGLYDFSNPDYPLDALQTDLEDYLEDYGVLDAEVEYAPDASGEVYIDLNFKDDQSLTFRIFIDPSGKPILECYAGESKGKSVFLPLNFSNNYKVSLQSNDLNSFPWDFFVSCIMEYMGVGLNESFELAKRVYVPKLMEFKFRKVIRNGQPQWVKLKPKKKRRVLLSIGQKMALRKAQAKAHSSSAEHNRAISDLKGDRLGVYTKPKVVSASTAPLS